MTAAHASIVHFDTTRMSSLAFAGACLCWARTQPALERVLFGGPGSISVAAAHLALLLPLFAAICFFFNWLRKPESALVIGRMGRTGVTGMWMLCWLQVLAPLGARAIERAMAQ